MEKISLVIIGGGITGLSVASSIKTDTLILERDEVLGGYCRTTKRNGFVWDRAGHFFHFNDQKIKDFFHNQIPEDRFVKVQKRTSIYFEEYRYIDFPFQKNIHQLPHELYIKCLTDLYKAEKLGASYDSFKEFVYSTMGAGISDLFLIPYNEKLYACDLNNLDKGAMGRFFPKANFEDVLLNAVDAQNSSYNQSFSYPVGGALEFINVMEARARENAEIRTNIEVTSVDLDNKTVQLGDGTQLQYEFLVNTAPLNRFCRMANIATDSARFSSNKVAVFNLGFDRKNDNDQHWVYYPGSEVFYRVGCYHNIFGKDRASLYVEIGLSQEQDCNEKTLLETVLADLEKVGMIDGDFQLIDHEFIVMDPAYVHINAQSVKFTSNIKERLREKGVYSAGRYGSWTYCSIEDNIKEGHEISDNIVCQNDKQKLLNIQKINLFGNNYGS